MDASVLPLGYCVVAEVGCNWYLLILIYSLYKKKGSTKLSPWEYGLQCFSTRLCRLTSQLVWGYRTRWKTQAAFYLLDRTFNLVLQNITITRNTKKAFENKLTTILSLLHLSKKIPCLVKIGSQIFFCNCRMPVGIAAKDKRRIRRRRRPVLSCGRRSINPWVHGARRVGAKAPRIGSLRQNATTTAGRVAPAARRRRQRAADRVRLPTAKHRVRILVKLDRTFCLTARRLDLDSVQLHILSLSLGLLIISWFSITAKRVILDH
jgi:hypothetical protein